MSKLSVILPLPMFQNKYHNLHWSSSNCSNWNEVMKVHVVFSLNVTGSIADDIIRVESSARYNLYGLYQLRTSLRLLDTVLTWMKRFFLILLQKKISSQNNIVQQHFWHKYSFHRLPNQVEKWRKLGVWQAPPGMEVPEGWGSKAKVPSGGGGRGMDIFWNYTIWTGF